jgi:hypothetical protein
LKTLLIAFCLLALPTAFGAATGLPTEDAARALANQSTLLLAQEKFDPGFAVLKPHWPLPPAEFQLVVRQTTKDWPRIRQRLGKTRDIRYLGKQRLSPTFVRYSYQHRFDKGAAEWQFTFQKYRNAWLVDGVAFVEPPAQP